MEWVNPDAFGSWEEFAEKHVKLVEIPLYFYARKKVKILRTDKATGRCVIQLANGTQKEVLIKSLWKKVIPKITGYKGLDEIGKSLGKNYIRRTADQVDAQLPEVLPLIYRVKMVPEAKKLYRKIADTAYDDSILAKMTHLRRCCAAPCLIEGGGDCEDSGKIAELIRLLETELAGETVIIVTQWKTGYMDILRKRLKKWKPLMMDGDTPNDERGEILEGFTNGDSKMLVMTEIGTRGGNLQIASVLVNMDMHDNPAKMWQRIGRIYRMFSNHKTIRIISFLMVNTVEERVYDKMSEKQELFRALFDTDGRERLGQMVDTWTDDDWKGLI